MCRRTVQHSNGLLVIDFETELLLPYLRHFKSTRLRRIQKNMQWKGHEMHKCTPGSYPHSSELAEQHTSKDTGWSSWSRKKLDQATAIDSTAQQRPSLRPPLREERRPNASTAGTNAIPGGLETLTLTSLIFPFGNLTEMRMPEGINIMKSKVAFAEFGARCLLFDRKLACLTDFHGLSNSSIQGPTTFVGWHFQASKARSSERTAYLVERRQNGKCIWTWRKR